MLIRNIALAGVALLILAGSARFLPWSPLASTNPDSRDRAEPASSQTLAASASPAAPQSASAAPTPSPTATSVPPLLFRPAKLTIKTKGFWSWALMDRRTGQIWGSANLAATTWPASMIKAWLVSDYLRRAAQSGQTPGSTMMYELEITIRDSDNNAAQDIYVRNGRSASIRRLISLCGLTDSKPNASGWSFTNISARDTVRMADCIADGTAAGPRWTAWVLSMMRKIRIGDFGIRKALPPALAATVSIKNGWLRYTDDLQWHVNCMAVAGTWAMAVLQRYPGHGMWDSDFRHGQDVCRQVAGQLLNPSYPLAG